MMNHSFIDFYSHCTLAFCLPTPRCEATVCSVFKKSSRHAADDDNDVGRVISAQLSPTKMLPFL